MKYLILIISGGLSVLSGSALCTNGHEIGLLAIVAGIVLFIGSAREGAKSQVSKNNSKSLGYESK